MKDNKGVSIIEYLIAIVLISTLVFLFSNRRLVFIDQVDILNDKNEAYSAAYTVNNYLKKFDTSTLDFYLYFYDYVVVNNTNCNFIFNSTYCNNAFYQTINDTTFDSSNLNAYIFWDDDISSVVSDSGIPIKVRNIADNLITSPAIDILYCIVYVQNGKIDDVIQGVISIET